MGQAKNGDKVKIHLVGTLEDGSVFLNTKDQEPIEFTVGGGKLLPGLESGVIGMETGGKKEINLPPDAAYGPRRDDMLVELRKSELPENLSPSVGDRLSMRSPDGDTVQVTVAGEGEDTITIDANHPLAGKTLNFDVELVGIVG